MGRRSGLEGFLRATSRSIATAQREQARQVRASATLARQHERQFRINAANSLRELKSIEKQAKADYLEMRQQEATDLNDQIADVMAELGNVLAHTLDFDDSIDFDSLRPIERFEPYNLPANLRPTSQPLPPEVTARAWWTVFVPGSKTRHELKTRAAQDEFDRHLAEFQINEASRIAALAKHRTEYENRKSEFDSEMAQRNAEVDTFKSDYFALNRDAVVEYCEMVLTRSEYPQDGFEQQFRVAYDPDTKAMAVEYELPLISIVPTESEFRYVKSKDSIESKARKLAEIKQIYQRLIAEITLRTIHELFEADQAGGISVLSFTGFIDTHDPATGNEVRVPVVSVRSPRETFISINLHRADPVSCLRSLGAHVSAKPDELLAVKPIVEFNMIDKRFIAQSDALSALETRQNLLALSPSEFEVLVANLFGKMGLETKLTRSSRDGGVDAVAYDSRPILGGKVVIQAKRYKDAVGVSAVRDLFGTMVNEGANKGILVTTSRYGPDAYTFASDKPIELIDGSGLLFLLREHAEIEARIVAPC
jgi:restriction system protein